MKNTDVCYYCKPDDLRCVFALFWHYLLLFFQPLVLFDRSGKCTESLGGKHISAAFKGIQWWAKNRLCCFFLSLKGIRKQLKRPLLRKEEA